MQDDLRHILQEIIRIDHLACENKSGNEMRVQERRQKYEQEMKAYEDAQLEEAGAQAQKLYEEAVLRANWQQKTREDQVKKEIDLLDQQYKHIEEDLLQTIMDKLFVLEG